MPSTPPRAIKFGVFDQNDSSGRPLGVQYEERLRLTELYDWAGFHAYHLSEHHATPLNMSPSPSVFLAAVAQRTRRLRFGPLVYTLPLHHPLRLAEEICLLDHMSDGRLEIGVGRGISPYEVGYWGLDPKTAPVQYREALDVVMQALATSELSFSGAFYTFKNVPIVMAPVQRPHPPLWCGVATPESALWALGHKASIVVNAPLDRAREIIAAYREGWAAARHAEANLPFLGISRPVVIAGTDVEALAIARRAWLRYHDSFHNVWKRHGSSPVSAITPPTFDEVIAMGMGLAGSPATVRAGLLAQVHEADCTYVVSRFAFGDLTYEESARSVDFFTREVMPAFAPRSDGG
jgi:alkanesulfonate monooxygenase SsuD/methylene tetrahydromethanopterin reductase-like flavin-dependent oxidoreductase (luciferase family)